MRYVAKFTKDNSIKFISHLDIMRTIQRVIRRAKLPAEYSKGFNPHMTLSLAQPLSVGIYSEGEYMDLVMVEEIEENIIKEKFNEASPNGIKILEVKKVPQVINEKKIPQVMALVEAAEYLINIRFKSTTDIKTKLESLLEQSQWLTLKKTKSGEKTVDIKPMIKNFEYTISENSLVIKTLISCGSRENLSAELLSEFLKSSIGDFEENAFVDIVRRELFTSSNNGYIPLFKYFQKC